MSFCVSNKLFLKSTSIFKRNVLTHIISGKFIPWKNHILKFKLEHIVIFYVGESLWSLDLVQKGFLIENVKMWWICFIDDPRYLRILISEIKLRFYCFKFQVYKEVSSTKSEVIHRNTELSSKRKGYDDAVLTVRSRSRE